MKDNLVILIAEDDRGHFELIKKNLWLYCVDSEIINFRDGQELLDFLFRKSAKINCEPGRRYILLLDIRMPHVDGSEVLLRLREDARFKKLPVIMLTTAEQPEQIEQCYCDGCSFYMVKPVDYQKFMEAVKNLGSFLSLDSLRIPPID